jgi:single-strand DNA-binding protein
MSSYNRVILIGRLTRDPEVSTTQRGTTMAKFGIAVDRRRKSQDGEQETDFFNIVAFENTAEFVSNYLGKGRLVMVEGKIRISKFVGQDGQPKYFTDIMADTVQGLDRPKDADSTPRPASTSAPANDGFTPDSGDFDPFAEE